MKAPKDTRILVVDDTDASRYGVVRHLQRVGYAVIEATTGDSAMRHIAEHPDLIVLDVQLPDANGLDISRAVRKNPTTSSIPILQISATYTQTMDRVKGLDAGADSYLASPVEPDELLANVRMLLRLRFAQQALADSNARLKSVLDNILDVYLAFDRNWNFQELNPPGQKLFGRSIDELRGKNLWTEYPQARDSKLAAQLQDAAQRGETFHFESESAMKPGMWLEGHAYPRGDRIEIYMRDITERKRAEIKLAEAASALHHHIRELQATQGDLSVAKNQLSLQNEALEARVLERTAKLQETVHDLETFSYSITHDMRAPLRAMQGFSKMLLESHGAKLDAEGTEFLNRIANAANRLDLLIRDVLSYSNIVRTELTPAPVDLDALVRDVIRDYPDFQPPKARIHIRDMLPPVMGNEAFLTQCFSNLIGNAVKFVEPGVTPEVEISSSRNGDFVRISIRDNGIGIPAAHQGGIFKLFHRAQNTYPGTGIGLAVVQKAAERMGGRVGLQSEEGKGSTFWLEFPAADSAA